jgi:dipeptidyl aminopeptidase/acylaminoacyl peptidase
LRRSWGLGAPEETPERWRTISPALNTERIRAPLLMQFSEQEARLATELYARLSNSTTPAELHIFPDEPHLKVQPRHRLAVFQRNLDWFRFWLLGHRDSDPAKAEQYRRWRALAERRSSAAP